MPGKGNFDDIIRQVLAEKMQAQPVGDVVPLRPPLGPQQEMNYYNGITLDDLKSFSSPKGLGRNDFYDKELLGKWFLKPTAND